MKNLESCSSLCCVDVGQSAASLQLYHGWSQKKTLRFGVSSALAC